MFEGNGQQQLKAKHSIESRSTIYGVAIASGFGCVSISTPPEYVSLTLTVCRPIIMDVSCFNNTRKFSTIGASHHHEGLGRQVHIILARENDCRTTQRILQEACPVRDRGSRLPPVLGAGVARGKVGPPMELIGVGTGVAGWKGELIAVGAGLGGPVDTPGWFRENKENLVVMQIQPTYVASNHLKYWPAVFVTVVNRLH